MGVPKKGFLSKPRGFHFLQSLKHKSVIKLDLPLLGGPANITRPALGRICPIRYSILTSEFIFSSVKASALKLTTVFLALSGLTSPIHPMAFLM